MNSRNLIIASAVIVILIIIASVFQSGHLWSLNAPGYISLVSVGIILTVAIILYILGIKFFTIDQQVFKPVFGTATGNLFVYLGVCLILMVIFNQFRSATYLWGDGYLRILETQSGMKFHFSEPLDKFVQYLFYNTIGSIFNFTAIKTHQIISILGGIFFFSVTIWWVKKFSSRALEQTIMAGLILSSAVMQLFFGYVESYCISTPLFLLAITQAYIEIRDHRPPIKGFLIYLLACLFHMSLLAYWPAFFVTVLLNCREIKSSRDRTSLVIVCSGLLFLIIIAFILNRLQFGGLFNKNIFEFLFIPIIPNNSGYWLFSPSHLLDLANLLLLTAPGALIIIISGFSLKTLANFSPAQKFMALLSACGLLFMLFFRTSFGLGRDWDLFSSVALPLNIFAAVMLIDKIAALKKYNLKLIFLPILIAMIISFNFIFSNSQEQASLQRYREITDLTAYGKNLNLENLGEYYLINNDYENYCIVLRQASAVHPHPRYNFKIGMLYMDQGRIPEALEYFQKAYQIDSTYIPAVNYLGITHGYLSAQDPGHLKLAEKYFFQVLSLDPTHANAYYNLGHVYYNMGDYQQAVQALRKAITYEPDNLKAYQNLGYSFEKLGQVDSAQYYFQLVSQKKK